MSMFSDLDEHEKSVETDEETERELVAEEEQRRAAEQLDLQSTNKLIFGQKLLLLQILELVCPPLAGLLLLPTYISEIFTPLD